MCPCSPSIGWYRSSSRRTPSEPTDCMTTAPPLTTGFSVASRAGALSMEVWAGGTCRLKIARSGRSTRLASLSMRRSRSSSVISRGVCQGVGLE